MIRYTETTGELRFFDDDDAPHMARFDASCVVLWEQPTVVWIRMLSTNAGSSVTRKMLRDLVDWLVEHRVEMVRSRRGMGHLLPLARLQPDGSFLNVVSDLLDYVSRGQRGPLAPSPPGVPQRRAGEADWQSTQPAQLVDERKTDAPAPDVEVP